ncbi:hypothetical protein LUZ61_000996 [Rhynchospora tenuis]|uniref:MYND-type domain-containing protein n=1 Tax=Rhynchospora tenuis TaxID=198213 RepID=A0AAD5ZG38_9POAL|nr:hypothetical protein LUZ61_000996 [Rhynchospora tenuis]
MRTRRGVCYTAPPEDVRRVRRRKLDPFEALPDDLILSIFAKLSATADSPSDLITLLLVCKRFNALAMDPTVLSVASEKCLGIRAQRWCDPAQRFLKRCVDAGNVEACFILGMIKFYALGSRPTGAALMARAAMRRHAAALYSLAVIQFNGSGGSKHDRDLRAGFALCFRAAGCGGLDALRELAYCLQDGYGVKRSISSGRRLLVLAASLELGYLAPAADEHVHVANQFLCEWFATRMGTLEGKGLRLCSHDQCGRVETRVHEFRRCSVCGLVNYCSRSCQALHWRKGHKAECVPIEQFLDNAAFALLV